MSVLFTEHSMDVVFAFADRIIVLARGKLIADGNASAIRQNPQVQEVYFGTGKTFERKAPALVMTDNAILTVHGLNAWYGGARILYDMALDVRARRSRGADGTQRRRQIHDHEVHHGSGRQASGPGDLLQP